jgi:hypothetical protein
MTDFDQLLLGLDAEAERVESLMVEIRAAARMMPPSRRGDLAATREVLAKLKVAYTKLLAPVVAADQELAAIEAQAKPEGPAS